MPKIDFAKAKADIAQIVDIVKTVPETLQQRCFELLFEAAFSELHLAPAGLSPKDKPGESSSSKENPPVLDKKLPANVMAFAVRNGVTKEQLEKLFMLDHEPLLPIYKIPTGNIAKSQLTKALMILLENGLLNNSLTAQYSELREAAKDDGLHDSNFNKVLKRNHALFRGAISEDSIDESGVVELTGAGMEKLAEVVKELGQ
jgi:hypothetical protein